MEKSDRLQAVYSESIQPALYHTYILLNKSNFF